MSVKRKSNWYIYFIAFGITIAFVVVAIFAFRWYLFPDKTESAGITDNGELADDFKPTSAHNFVMLSMLSDAASDNPDLFTMISYNAVDNEVCLIPLPSGLSVELTGSTLSSIYFSDGGEAVVKAVEEAVGVKCGSFVKMDREAFVSLVTAFGNVEYDVGKTTIINDGNTVETINSGEQLFTAEKLFGYIMKADFSDELSRLNSAADILSELINQNFRNLDSSILDVYYNMIFDECDTNITDEQYKSRKPALLNTVEYGNQPAGYYIPYGEYTEDGGFRISENSIVSIKQRTGLM
ncbi:MAG: LCP family protein [Oscillospiraceae bacterium]|nr:LCP family protein [Oscillospiraceae bacterium]